MSDTSTLKEVQSVIIALLTGEQEDEIDLVKLDNLYKQLEDTRIPFQSLGYSSLIELLKTIPEIDIKFKNGRDMIHFAGKESTKHVRKLVECQKPKYRGNRNRFHFKKIPPQYHAQYSQAPSSESYDLVSEEIFHIISRNPHGILPDAIIQIYSNRHPRIHFDTKKLTYHLRKIKNEVMFIGDKVYPLRGSRIRNSTSQPFSTVAHGANTYDTYNSETANETTLKKYKAQLDSINDDIDDGFEFVPYTKKMNEKFEEENEIEIPKSTSDFIAQSISQNDQCNLEKYSIVNPTEKNYSKMQFEQKTLNENNDSFSRGQGCHNILSEKLLRQLEKLIQKNPNGIRCMDLPNKFKKEYGISLDWKSLGFRCIVNLVANLPQIFHMIGPLFDGGDYYLYYAKRPLSIELVQNVINQKFSQSDIYDIHNDGDNEDDDDNKALPSNISIRFTNPICPNDVMMNGESVGQICVTQFKVSSYGLDQNQSLALVRVVEAFSPSFFWIHIENARKKFENMMEKLQIFYENQKDKYMIPNIHFKAGLNVACMFYGKWHRAIIKAVDAQFQITILFYDYGTVKTYPSNQIFFLHRSFSDLPAQAIPCGLYNARPYNGNEWSKKAIDWFITHVHDRLLWMVVGKIDIKTNSMLISLTDTSTLHDFHVSDKMFEKKLAIQGSMEFVDPEDLSNYIEDYGEDSQVCDESAKCPIEPQKNILKLPSDITSATVKNLCHGLSILEKKQNIIMTTKDSIESLQISVQKILLGYSATILRMYNADEDLDKLTNITSDVAKTIITEFYSALTTVQMNSTAELNSIKSSVALQQSSHHLNNSDTYSHPNNPSKVSSRNGDTYPEMQLNNKINDADTIPVQSHAPNISMTFMNPVSSRNEDIDLINNGGNFGVGVIGEKTAKILRDAENSMLEAKQKMKLGDTLTNNNLCYSERRKPKTIIDHLGAGKSFGPIIGGFTIPSAEDYIMTNSINNSKVKQPVQLLQPKGKDGLLTTTPNIVTREIQLPKLISPMWFINNKHSA